MSKSALENPMNDPMVIAVFEKHLSGILAGSGLSAYGAIQAMAVALARILHGLQQLIGEEGATEGAAIFDTVLEAALLKMVETSSPKSPTVPGNTTVN